MFYIHEQQLTYDDVLLVPQKSLPSRSLADTTSKIGPLALHNPVMSANMKSVTWYDMAKAMHENGGIGVLHRGCTIQERIDCATKLKEENVQTIVSVGLKDHIDDIKRLVQVCPHLNLDIANAYSDSIAKKIREIKSNTDCFLMVGNIATAEAALFLQEAGADAIKVGIGPGSVCTTRLVTGHGFPQFSAVRACSSAVQIPVIADGGLKEVGDIAKAIGSGACAVMSGYLFAGCEESAGQEFNGSKEYAGMASIKGIVKRNRIEGIVGAVKKTGNVKENMDKIKAGLQSAMSYSNSKTIEEFQRKAKFIRVTPHALKENYPRC